MSRCNGLQSLALSYQFSNRVCNHQSQDFHDSDPFMKHSLVMMIELV